MNVRRCFADSPHWEVVATYDLRQDAVMDNRPIGAPMLPMPSHCFRFLFAFALRLQPRRPSCDPPMTLPRLLTTTGHARRCCCRWLYARLRETGCKREKDVVSRPRAWRPSSLNTLCYFTLMSFGVLFLCELCDSDYVEIAAVES